jgi:hypothetical protein
VLRVETVYRHQQVPLLELISNDNMAKIGAFTTNEIRETAGWPAIAEPWADEVRLPLGVQIGNEPQDFSE